MLLFAPMTILGEREALPTFTESVKPNQLTYVRLQGEIGYARYEVTHSDLARDENLFDPDKTVRRPVVTDAGIIEIEGDLLIIGPYKTSSTLIDIFRKQFSSVNEMEEAFRLVRRETAEILSKKTEKNVKLLFEDGTEETVSVK